MELKDFEARIQVKLNKLESDDKLTEKSILDYLVATLSEVRSDANKTKLLEDLRTQGLFFDTELSNLYLDAWSVYNTRGTVNNEVTDKLGMLAAKIYQFAVQGAVNFSDDPTLGLDNEKTAIADFIYRGNDISDKVVLSDLRDSFPLNILEEVKKLIGHDIFNLHNKYPDGRIHRSVWIFSKNDMPLRIYSNLGGKISGYVEPAKMNRIGKVIAEELSQLVKSRGDLLMEADISKLLKDCELTINDDSREVSGISRNVFSSKKLELFRVVDKNDPELTSILKALKVSTVPDNVEFKIGDLITNSGNAKLLVIKSINKCEIILIDSIGAHIITISGNVNEELNHIVNFITETYNGKENCNQILMELARLGLTVAYHDHIRSNSELAKLIPSSVNFSESIGSVSSSLVFGNAKLDTIFDEGSTESNLIISAYSNGKLCTATVNNNGKVVKLYVIDSGDQELTIIVTIDDYYMAVKLGTELPKEVILNKLSQVVSTMEITADLTSVLNKLSVSLTSLGKVDPM